MNRLETYTVHRRCNSNSSISSTNVAENTETIPIDLLIEILSRLPAKVIARFRCVSKLWDSLLRHNYFTESFLKSSSTRPRFLFAFQVSRKWHFFSSLQPQNLDENGVLRSIRTVTADYHMSFSGVWCDEVCLSAYGFICLIDKQMLKGKLVSVPMICNPSTGHHLILPKVRARNMDLRSFFCYEPITKRLKVLCMTVSTYRNQTNSKEHQVLTLGDGKKPSWRKIECSLCHYPYPYSWNTSNGICINGVLYYIARSNMTTTLIACFDVMSETFSFIDVEKFSQRGCVSKLLEYKGKLSVLMYALSSNYELWVLDDKEKDKWSMNVLPKTGINEGKKSVWSNERGEVFWLLDRWTLPLYVYYYKVETKCFGRIEVKGIVEKILMDQNIPEAYFIFTDHIENVMFL